VGIAGGDFGCEIDVRTDPIHLNDYGEPLLIALLSKGSCPTGSAQLPLGNLGGGDGEGQMKHFVQDDQMNMFRLRALIQEPKPSCNIQRRSGLTQQSQRHHGSFLLVVTNSAPVSMLPTWRITINLCRRASPQAPTV